MYDTLDDKGDNMQNHDQTKPGICLTVWAPYTQTQIH